MYTPFLFFFFKKKKLNNMDDLSARLLAHYDLYFLNVVIQKMLIKN